MRSAFVKSYGPTGGRPTLVARDGSFSLAYPRPGGYFLTLAGVHHKTWFVPLLLERRGATEFEVRLSAADYVAAFDSVRVIGDFGGFTAESAIPMARQSNGTFVATVPCDHDTLGYQLLGVQAGGYPICGTQADSFIVDRTRPLIGERSGNFVSLLQADSGAVRVVFDPRELPRGGSLPAAALRDTSGKANAIVVIYQDAQRREERMVEAYTAFRAGGGAPDSFHWDASPDLKVLAARIDQEDDPTLRGYLLLQYVRLTFGEVDQALARRVLREIPEDSPLWSLLWGGPGNTLSQIAHAVNNPDMSRAYAEKLVEVHADPSVRADVLLFLLSEARRTRELQRAGRYYTRITTEFASTTQAELARKRFAPNRGIMKGKVSPDFAMASLADSTRIYRLADFHGKYVLIDFWATWCAPCIRELHYLQRAHADYKDLGLVVLSVSFDENRSSVSRFRSTRRPMPWLHAFEPRGFASDAARAFEIAGIPRPILIDPVGKIVAVDEELRGERLDRTLAAVFGRRRSSAGLKN